MLKQKTKDREFSGVEEIMNAVQEIWREMTLERLQSVFFNWIERLECVIEYDGEYFLDLPYFHSEELWLRKVDFKQIDHFLEDDQRQEMASL
jgi:hypothetical protein